MSWESVQLDAKIVSQGLPGADPVFSFGRPIRQFGADWSHLEFLVGTMLRMDGFIPHELLMDALVVISQHKDLTMDAIIRINQELICTGIVSGEGRRLLPKIPEGRLLPRPNRLSPVI